MPSRVNRHDPLDATRRRTWRAVRSILSWVETEKLMMVAMASGHHEPSTLAALSAASGFISGAGPDNFRLHCVAGSVLVRVGDDFTVFAVEPEAIAVARWRVRQLPDGPIRKSPVLVGPDVPVGFVRVGVAS